MDTDEKIKELKHGLYQFLSISFVVVGMIFGIVQYGVTRYLDSNAKKTELLEYKIADIDKRTYDLATDIRELNVNILHIKEYMQKINDKLGDKK